jgi:glc operon protein GlcG
MKTLRICAGMVMAVFCFSVEAQTINVTTLDQVGAQAVLQAAKQSAEEQGSRHRDSENRGGVTRLHTERTSA